MNFHFFILIKKMFEINYITNIRISELIANASKTFVVPIGNANSIIWLERVFLEKYKKC